MSVAREVCSPEPTWCCRAGTRASLLSPVSVRAPGPRGGPGGGRQPGFEPSGRLCPRHQRGGVPPALWFSGCPPHSWAQGSRVMRRRPESVRPFPCSMSVCVSSHLRNWTRQSLVSETLRAPEVWTLLMVSGAKITVSSVVLTKH